jgi:hypothetical protein
VRSGRIELSDDRTGQTVFRICLPRERWELVEGFEATYQGNHLGVRLLEKRARRGKVEYLVEWRGRPGSENSWEKEATISRERIMEFEAN